MRLYHFTAVEHLAAIERDGFIKTVESNVSPTKEHAGPDVVWLTDDPEPAHHRGWQDTSIWDKTAVRITVDLPPRAVHRWRAWAHTRGVPHFWQTALARVGGSGSWYVVEHPIPRQHWLDVEVLKH